MTETKHPPGNCPFCNSEDIDWGHREFYDGTPSEDYYQQNAACRSCGQAFIECHVGVYVGCQDEEGTDIGAPADPRLAPDLLAEVERLRELLRDATQRLEGFIGADCECDNTHEANKVTCCLCEYRTALEKGA